MWKLAIDLGSSVTKIYRADTSSGIVLAEPSCVAVAGEEQEVKAIGKEAKSLIGKTAEYTSIIYPVYEGEIVDMRLAAAMLRAFLTRVGVKASALSRAQILLSVPCGASEAVLSDYVLLAEECGLKKVYFVEQPYLAAVGAGAILTDSDPVFCIDIGGGVTNVAVVSADGIIAGLSMNIGGNNMDSNVLQRVAKVNKLRIGALTAERIKNEIGSFSPSARGSIVAEGSSLETLRPAASSVQATEIADCLRVYVDKILEYAGSVLKKLPAEVAATVNRNGVFLSGGVMKIPYLPQYIGAKLEMRYHVCEEPQFATVLGGGAVVRDKELLAQFGKEIDD
ncbi:MAG: rod shape-determining protein [Clostridia bacterium]|nr:rod shape-determining protein [Clostridia bacterium]